jgi:hypothetical protein
LLGAAEELDGVDYLVGVGSSYFDHGRCLIIRYLAHVALILSNHAAFKGDQDLSSTSTRNTGQPRELELEIVLRLIILHIRTFKSYSFDSHLFAINVYSRLRSRLGRETTDFILAASDRVGVGDVDADVAEILESLSTIIVSVEDIPKILRAA